MSDTPTADPTPEAAAPEPAPAPSTVAVAEPPAPAPAQEAAPVAAAPVAPAAPPPARRQVQVPIWLLAVLGVIVLAVGAFFVGRSTAPETSGPKTLAEAVQETASGDMEVGEFNARDLIAALQQNDELNLGNIGDILDLLGDLNSNNR